MGTVRNHQPDLCWFLRCAVQVHRSKGLLRTLRTGTGRQFILVLPQDFLKEKYSDIEDCSIDTAAMKRWRLAKPNSEGG